MKSLFQDSFKLSILRNSIVQLFWWVIFFPGFYSTDSFTAVSQAQSGDLENTGSASWSLYIRYFSFYGNAISLLTLISGLALTYSVTCLAYSVSSRKVAAISSLVLVSTPLIYAMGITLWHDIPFTAGLILVSAYFSSQFNIKCELTNRFWILLFPGSVLLTFRPNGIPTLIIFAVIYLPH
jgi:4-amino-4-deoxy-L-arabinose transferase-like glycosyltransferase